ncbi:unnamed protein product [Clonostachys rosea f. rosea IK726]|uniref:Uncharacterized protein n=1 Tax=Clonostachys rosea f. rosea IK726 TaxID=1349383 RepID=A0ACA9UEF8_BIOOC|nr:unnamed protein product [Clonostachys rosea f. rosea IK726]
MADSNPSNYHPQHRQQQYNDGGDEPVSAVSPASAGHIGVVSPLNNFTSISLFSPVGYSPLDGSHDQSRDMELLEVAQGHNSASASPKMTQVPGERAQASDLGITVFDNSNVHQVPVAHNPSVGGAKSVRAFFGGTPGSSAASTPSNIRSRSPAFAPDMGGSAQQAAQDTGENPNHQAWLMPPGENSPSATPSQTNSVPGSPRKLGAKSRKLNNSSDDEEEFDDGKFYSGFGAPPSCDSRKDIHIKRSNWLSIIIYILSVYSTIMSGLWLVTAILQPRWGRDISSRKGLSPSTATTLAALAAKSIEMSFVTVFISFLGQVLTRRSLLRNSKGMTLAEITMRNWVIQPGSLITHGETLPEAGLTILGLLSLTATLAATFYTTASDAMVAPKLKFGNWDQTVMEGHIMASYGNALYISKTCPSLISKSDTLHGSEACMNIQSSGQSYRDLLNFMDQWQHTYLDGNVNAAVAQVDRPLGTSLYENTTMVASWIETDNSDVEASFKQHNRIINNITMAMPHPGVQSAAKEEFNGILQPDDLGGVGSYSIRAGVVSPTVNVMCVNMNKEELEPLIYTAWPDARTNSTGVGDQLIGAVDWTNDFPNIDDDKDFLNRTKVDDIFRWGPKYQRRPPYFQLYPSDYNTITNSTMIGSEAIYLLGKKPDFSDYTLCELRSWVSPKCSTRFDISGTSGAKASSYCEDPEDKDSFMRSYPGDEIASTPAPDWKWVADAWRLSMDVSGGVYNNNASNARLLTQLVLSEPKMPTQLPSMAEALAVYIGSTLVTSSIKTPFRHYWDSPQAVLEDPGQLQAFNASIRSQQYTSGHVNDWQAIFYAVLALVFAINLFCLLYLFLRSGLVTDYTEPQNLFALAINSPPSAQLKGSCGGGPEKRDVVVPWRVAYAPSANHYFFEEAADRPKAKYIKVDEGVTTGANPRHLRPQSSYKRLSSSRDWNF